VRDAENGEIVKPVTATIGSAEQYALTVTIDLRTNSLLLGGTDHYVGLAAEIIEALDSTPAQEHRTEVYRLKNSLATNVVTALTAFLDQERKGLINVAEQADAGTNAVSTVVGNLQQQFEREVAIVAEPVSNTLLLSASPRYFDKFKALIEQLDQPMSQVLIQVVLAEVTLDKTSELGVEWAMQSTHGNTKIQTGTDFGVADQFKQLGGFSSAITGSDISFVLRALEADGRLEVLSRPQILTADNQKATIDIGDRVPLVTDSRTTPQGDTINTFAYEDVGVSLTVTPRISPDGFVKMEVEPTVSQLSSSSVTVSPGINTPVISQRKATTTVSVQNGQSVIIGGLISTSDDRRRSKVPFLGNIPYLGFLFRSSKAVENRKELLIILTPQLLTGSDALAQADTARHITQDQLSRSTIKDEIKRDKLQQEILEPLLPLMEKPGNSPTNSVAVPRT
jgi:type II secretion system protein D